MTDTVEKSRLWEAREAEGLAREQVARQLDPPVSVKTIERWERGDRKGDLPRWRLRQLAQIYNVRVSDLKEDA